ncbi:MAG: hypothetical protein ACFFDT_21410 [Candidatus Hodarchaeota archaeon]
MEQRQAQYDEAGVRRIMLDITLAGTYAYFNAHRDEANPKEALRRWDAGVRVVNADEFERKEVGAPGNWRHTYKGTTTEIDGMDVILTTDTNSQQRVITKLRTGIFADDVVRIWVSHMGIEGQYSVDGRVENTNGIRLHQFYINVSPYEVQYDDSFKELFVEFHYDGHIIRKKSIKLPDAGIIAMAARDDRLPDQPIVKLEYEHVKTKFIIVGADVDPSSRTRGYTSIDLRVVIEIVE